MKIAEINYWLCITLATHQQEGQATNEEEACTSCQGPSELCTGPGQLATSRSVDCVVLAVDILRTGWILGVTWILGVSRVFRIF